MAHAARQPTAPVASATPTRPTSPPSTSVPTYHPIALAPIRGTSVSTTYGAPTTSKPGMQSPCRIRAARSTSKVGASATSSVGPTRSRLARRIDRGRPMRSERGPHSHAASASARTRAETLSPARAGLTSKLCESSGRIACVEYIAANIPNAPSRNPRTP